MMGRFRRFLNDLELLELHLHGRLFTWSNECTHPTLQRIDRVFVSPDWELLFPSSALQAISSRCSDHSPLLLSLENCTMSKRRFTFLAFWPKVAGFLDTIKAVWSAPRLDADPLRLMNHLLRETAKALVKWSAKAVGSIRMQIQVSKEVIFCLQVAQESRSLSWEELSLRRFLKLRYLGLTSLQRTITRQKSSLRWLREGGAFTKLFHLHANHRCRKNYIPSLLVDGRTLTCEDEKAIAAFTFFDGILGATHERSCALAFDELGLPRLDLQDLGQPFTEAEIWEVIKELPLDKAPGPDGFTGRFYRSCWSIILGDILRALMLYPTWIVVASII
jgi:hypothetical protein